MNRISKIKKQLFSILPIVTYIIQSNNNAFSIPEYLFINDNSRHVVPDDTLMRVSRNDSESNDR